MNFKICFFFNLNFSRVIPLKIYPEFLSKELFFQMASVPLSSSQLISVAYNFISLSPEIDFRGEGRPVSSFFRLGWFFSSGLKCKIYKMQLLFLVSISCVCFLLLYLLSPSQAHNKLWYGPELLMLGQLWWRKQALGWVPS